MKTFKQYLTEVAIKDRIISFENTLNSIRKFAKKYTGKEF